MAQSLAKIYPCDSVFSEIIEGSRLRMVNYTESIYQRSFHILIPNSIDEQKIFIHCIY